MLSVPRSSDPPATIPAPSRWVTVLAVGVAVYSALLVLFSFNLGEVSPGHGLSVVPFWAIAVIISVSYTVPMMFAGRAFHWRIPPLLLTAFFLGWVYPCVYLSLLMPALRAMSDFSLILLFVAGIGSLIGSALTLLTSLFLPLSRYRWPRFALWLLPVAATGWYLVSTTITQHGMAH